MQFPPPSQENVQPQLSPIEKSTQELEDFKTQLAQATKDKYSEDETIALNEKNINQKTNQLQQLGGNLKTESSIQESPVPADNVQSPKSTQSQQQIPHVQENIQSAEQVQPSQSPKAESPKIKSTFAQDILPDENNVIEGDKTNIFADNGNEYEVQYSAKKIAADKLRERSKSAKPKQINQLFNF